MKTGFKSQNLFAKLDGAIVVQAISDLKRVDERNFLLAAEYFFLDGNSIDEKYPKTFTALCVRNGLDPDRAARAVWDKLTQVQQERVLWLLKEAGFGKI